MNERTEYEIYKLADEALARIHSVGDDPQSIDEHGEAIEKNLELIRRRTDPAVGDSNE